MGHRVDLLIGLVVAMCLLAPGSAHATTAPFLGESIAGSDGTQTDRLNQTGPSSCVMSAPPQAHGMGGTRHLDTFRFRNIGPDARCVTVTLNTACAGGKTLMSAAYKGSFGQPADLTTDFLGHLGTPAAGQASYGFTVPGDTDFLVTVTELNPDDGCSSYDLTANTPFASNILERNDGLAAGDATETGRPYRNGANSTCAAPRTNPESVSSDTSFRYDAFTFTNVGSTPSCVTVQDVAPACAVGTIGSVAYIDDFHPDHPLDNFLAFGTASSTEHYGYPYSFNVPARRAFVVVVSDGGSPGGCAAYHLSVDGDNVVVGRPDSDADGVPDISDACANESDLSAPRSPRTGCPADSVPPDADGDGVPDSSDACPSQSDATAQRSPRNGCPAGATAGDDVLNGDALANVICGLLGNDTINGRGGDDTLFGDACGLKAQPVFSARAAVRGHDQLSGDGGDEPLLGGARHRCAIDSHR